MRKYSIEVSVGVLSNKSFIVSIDNVLIEKYVEQINQYQNSPITIITNNKKYSHKTNNDLLLAIIKFFDDKKSNMIIFNEEDKIKSIADFEIMLLNKYKNVKLDYFENHKALQYLQDQNLLSSFLSNTLKVNVVSYYSEYSKQFGERISIKTNEEVINDLKKVEQYIHNSMLIDEYNNNYIYSYSRKVKVISLKENTKHVVIDNGEQWLEQLVKKNEHHTNGFPYANNEVIDNKTHQLLSEIKKPQKKMKI